MRLNLASPDEDTALPSTGACMGESNASDCKSQRNLHFSAVLKQVVRDVLKIPPPCDGARENQIHPEFASSGEELAFFPRLKRCER